MLGTLDDDQALSLIEALVAADGERVMQQINDAAARGVEWEALLVEMLGLLHRVAMVQLSPSALGADMAPLEPRLRELARVVPPGDSSLRDALSLTDQAIASGDGQVTAQAVARCSARWMTIRR